MGYDVVAVERALRTGLYSEAARLLRNKEDSSTEISVLSVETAYYLGDSNRTRNEGRRLLDSPTLTDSQRARCAFVLACQFCDDSEFEAGIAMCHKTVALADQCKRPEIAAVASAYLLERAFGHHAFDAARSLAAHTRRSAARCGDPQARATVHATFARVEARAGHFDTALRHICVARVLLEQDPNLRLAVAIAVDEASIRGLCGDLPLAVSLTTQASEMAKESGWCKGIVMTAGNLAHMLAELGDTEAAEKCLQTAAGQPHRYDNYDWPIAQTRAQMALRAGDYNLAERVLAEHQPTSTHSATAKWYWLSAELTKARLLMHRKKWAEALRCSELGITRANEIGADNLAISFTLARAEALASLGDSVAAISLLLTRRRIGWPPALLGDFWVVFAKSCRRAHPSVALHSSMRAVRLFEATGTEAAREGAAALVNELRSEAQLSSGSEINAEAFAALFELAEYRHVVAREAFALLDQTGCLQSSALLTIHNSEFRIVQSRGWDEEEALTAARKRERFEIIDFGEHAGYVWQIIVQPRPEMHFQHTLSAIRKLVDSAVALDDYRRAEKQRAALWPTEDLESDSDNIWASEEMSEVVAIARRIASTPLTVLLTGETGTGKEMLARDIHRASDRGDRLFLPFNCTAVPRDMLESQLFGYRKGAFTGADASFQGVIRSAAGGTLFLDEIADVPLDVQPKLLRFLETHEIHPLGEPLPIKVDVRIVAATNANMERLVAEGRFREDLFYRLNIVRLKLPPLRERREEIPALVHHYLRRFGDEEKKGQLTLADETLEYLLLHPWPGNVRQLANEVHRMVVMAEPDSALTPAHLSPDIRASRLTIPATAAHTPGEPEVRVRLDQPLPLAVEMLEQTMIRSALKRSRGRVEEAAKLLGISRKGLFLKRRRWNLDQTQPS